MDIMNNLISYFQKNRVIKHVVFWCVMLILSIPKGIFGYSKDPLYVIVFMHFCILVSQILISYYLAYFVIPKYLLKKKYIITVILFVIGTYIFSVVARVMVIHVGEELVRFGPFTKEPIPEILTDWRKLLVHYVPSIYSIALIFLSVKYFTDYKRIKEQDVLLSKEKTENELKVLKSQLNPHFLFNTLNNIYALSLSNSPQTAISIGKLSEILDHVLYKCDSKFVPLKSEVELLENYIALEKLRYDDRLKIDFNSNLNKEIEIPPLILLSLVENAFKHGAGEDSGSPIIGIDIYSNTNSFTFKIYNSISEGYQSKKEKGIGLLNIEKQLDLIYQNRYSLTKEEEKNKFTVQLKINIE